MALMMAMVMMVRRGVNFTPPNAHIPHPLSLSISLCRSFSFSSLLGNASMVLSFFTRVSQPSFNKVDMHQQPEGADSTQLCFLVQPTFSHTLRHPPPSPSSVHKTLFLIDTRTWTLNLNPQLCIMTMSLSSHPLSMEFLFSGVSVQCKVSRSHGHWSVVTHRNLFCRASTPLLWRRYVSSLCLPVHSLPLLFLKAPCPS